jgi:hypothetical protein
VRKVNSINQNLDFWVWENVLPKWFCEQQINSLDWDKSIEARIEGDIDHSNILQNTKRITDILWESKSSPIGCVAQFYLKAANESANWGFDLTSYEMVQLGRYSSINHGFYGWHHDAGFTVNSNNLVRKLSMSILLNDESSFEGGLFEFKDLQEQPILKQGSILVFPSYLEHQVLPVTSGNRYSAVTWASGPAYPEHQVTNPKILPHKIS